MDRWFMAILCNIYTLICSIIYEILVKLSQWSLLHHFGIIQVQRRLNWQAMLIICKYGWAPVKRDNLCFHTAPAFHWKTRSVSHLQYFMFYNNIDREFLRCFTAKKVKKVTPLVTSMLRMKRGMIQDDFVGVALFNERT